MKKCLSLILAVIMLALLVSGCGGNDSENVKGPEGKPSEIIESIYEKKTAGELSVLTVDVDLSDKNAVKSYLGLDSADKIKEASASESALGAQAYSLVIARVNDEADAEEIAKSMRDGIDPRKWICVEADDIRTVACGDVIMFVMVSTEYADSFTADDLADAFKEVCGGTLTVDLQ